MARAAKKYRITIVNTDQTIDCTANQTVLEAAAAAGVDFPYACATGNCGTCTSRLDGGKVSLLSHNDACLTPVQVKAVLTLACRARPRGDLTIRWLSRSSA